MVFVRLHVGAHTTERVIREPLIPTIRSVLEASGLFIEPYFDGHHRFRYEFQGNILMTPDIDISVPHLASYDFSLVRNPDVKSSVLDDEHLESQLTTEPTLATSLLARLSMAFFFMCGVTLLLEGVL